MNLGLASDDITLACEHQTWRAAFEQEHAILAAALGEHARSIEHVGSTAIPEVPAKPILDILVGVSDFERAYACVGPMVAVGYQYRGENGIPRRHYFVKGIPRTHHVHMLELQSESWKQTLRFRDLLRSNPDLAGEYAREKVRLVKAHFGDRVAYQREKGSIVEWILQHNPVHKPL